MGDSKESPISHLEITTMQIFKVGDRVKGIHGTRVFVVGEVSTSTRYGYWWNTPEAIGTYPMRRMDEYILVN
jgi:hypothetical protein